MTMNYKYCYLLSAVSARQLSPHTGFYFLTDCD